MKFLPLFDKVLVEPIIEKETRVAGIVIPDACTDSPSEGVVVKLGTGKTLENGQRTQFEVKIGDRVLFNRFGGQDVKIDGRLFKLFDSHEILAVIE